MLRWLLLGAVLILSACASAPQPPPAYPNVLPGTTTWALTPGSWAEYDVTQGSGSVDLSTGAITVNAASMTLLDHVRVTNIATTIAPGSTQLATARCSTEAGIALVALPADTTTCLFERQSWSVIGESGNWTTLLDPVEPLLTVNPIAGEVVTGTTIVSAGGSLVTEYRTLQVGGTYDGLENAIVTSLIERPGVQPRAYMYVFSGGELAEIEFGDVAGDGSITNLVFYRQVRAGLNL